VLLSATSHLLRWGGDVGRVYYVGKSTSKFAEVAASVVVERVIGVGALVILVLIASSIEYDLAIKSGIIVALIVGGVATVLSLAAGYLLWKFGLHRMLRGRRLGGAIGRGTEFLTKVSDSFRLFPRALAPLSVSLALSIVFHLGSIGSSILLFRALSIDVSFTQLMLLIPAINLLALFPLSINGLGVVEGGYAILLSQIGLPFEQALGVALLARGLLMIASLSGGIVLLGLAIGWLSLAWEEPVKLPAASSGASDGLSLRG